MAADKKRAISQALGGVRMQMRSIRIAVVAVVVAAAALVPATAAGAAGPYLYKSTVPLGPVGNLPSVGPEAYAFKELGNQITLDHAGKVGSVVVTLSSWACQSGHWNTGNCSSTPGAKVTVPITFNIYNRATGTTPVAGSLIASAAKSFAIPYRPSAVPVHCTGSNAGKWWGGSPKRCLNGKAVNITFTFANVALPADVVYGISYNSTHYGYHPIGESAPCFATAAGCFYDSLNIALTKDPTDVSAGHDPGPTGTIFQYSSLPGQYCDGGTGGINVFREDSPTKGCWSVSSVPGTSPYYIPAVQLNAKSANDNEDADGDQGDQTEGD